MAFYQRNGFQSAILILLYSYKCWERFNYFSIINTNYPNNIKNARSNLSFSDAIKASGGPSKNTIQNEDTSGKAVQNINVSGKTSPIPIAGPILSSSIPSKSMPSSSALFNAADLLKLKEKMKKEIVEQICNDDFGSESNTRMNRMLNNPFYPLDFDDDIEEFVPETKEPAPTNDGFINVRRKK